MFVDCENMKWNHLPVTGGIYDQHPKLLDQWRYIFNEKHKYEEKQRKAAEQKRGKVAGRRGH